MSTYILRIIQKKAIKIGLVRQIPFFFLNRYFLMNLLTVSMGGKRGKAKIVKKNNNNNQHPTLRRRWTVVLNMD